MQLWIGGKKFTVFLLGLILISFGISAMIKANIGVSPWDVFHIGLSKNTPLTVGQAIQVVGIVLVFVSWVLGYKPGVGTILNMILIGFFYDLIIKFNLLPTVHVFYQQFIYFLIGLLLMALGTGLYINASWGGGPRDSVMLALNKKFGVRIGIVRGLMEVTVLITGYLMGGPVGIGTVLFSVLIGFFVEYSLKVTVRVYELIEFTGEKEYSM